MPGLHTYFVGDVNGRPLLVLTEQLSATLSLAMPDIVAAVRQIVGKRSFTVVFDRGGFDNKLFEWLDKEQIGFITYQRGEPNLPATAFVHQGDAKQFLWDLRERFAKYSLELNADKTRLIQFGRFAAQNRAERGLGKPATFDFLGHADLRVMPTSQGSSLSAVAIGPVRSA